SWLGFGPSALQVDRLSGLFLALTGATGLIASLAHVEQDQGRSLSALHGWAVLGTAVAVCADQAFLFFIAWEGLAIVIYLIASADRGRPGALSEGFFTGAITKVGGAALLAAFALLYGRTGTFQFAGWAHAAGHLDGAARGALFALLVLAFGTKVGILPVQGGLPVGYGAAPRAGAASLAVALCAGFYGLWRFVVTILAPAPVWWGEALLIVGAFTALGGILYAITQDDVRRFLGFSTVEHAGVMLLGLGVALLGQSAHNPTLTAAGLLAATLHLVAHNLAKTVALVATDRIGRATGRRGMDGLGGLARALPRTSAGLTLACLTLAAVPPLGGFVSEWFTFEALLQGFRLPELLARVLCALAAAALALTGGIGFLAFAKLLGFVAGARARDALGVLREPSAGLAVVAGGLLLLALGAVAPWEIRLLGSALRGVLGFDPAGAAISYPLVLGPVFAHFSVLAPTWLYLVIPGYALVAAGIALAARGRRTVRRAPVWVTGSGLDPARVQYRPSAYSNPLRVVLAGLLGYRSTVRPGEPGDESGDAVTAVGGNGELGRTLVLETRVVLAVDRFFYRPLAAAALALAARARATQSGRLTTYLLYMLGALVAVLILIPALR
ncbi:MAG: proton-conducting transporter membrane subunit, partial [Solirubrobacteraceae bacterium]